jgi:hypothetical protein
MFTSAGTRCVALLAKPASEFQPSRSPPREFTAIAVAGLNQVANALNDPASLYLTAVEFTKFN